ncbi:helix-turn-helix domain-containing protein [Komagataeibacter melaceti]|uniref:Helix-turn-helix domain-containing protein n=1 Tax=Komagataeibacter melaceti TaxID=2766577 RepID=A0A371Z262_9PROT|nr:helix-turn-helix domain-containing protein [Komagataeibacter melaceti]RFD20567.1 helix-turn-helix domain-containing protein [Komagataeibacter melaceti]
MSDGKRMFRSTPATPDATPEAGKAAPSSVGDELRAKREEMGWKLPDVAAWLRIRLSYLEALEGGRPGELPGSAYAVGFLRTYAKALGLNPEPLVERFKAESRGAFTRRAELSFPVPLPDRGLPTGVLLLCGIVILVGAYAGWYRLTGSPDVNHDAPARLTLPGLSSATTASPQVASVLPPADEQPVPPPQPLPPQEREALTGTPATPPATAPAPVPLAPTPAPQLEKMGGDPVPAQVPEPTPAPTDSITLSATAPTWVQVRKPGGPVLYDHVLQPGETWQTPQGLSGLELTVGNAGGLTLSAAGVTTQPLGRNGEVRRNIVLTPQAVADGSVLRAQAVPVAPPVTGNGNNPPSPLPPHVDPE